jgi:4-aminobutyrate aminotransferase-like enzyme
MAARNEGSLTRRTLLLLEQFESRNITFIDPEGDWPIVWDRAAGNFVWDVEGKRYVDLTAAFGVAAAGHSNWEVSRAGCAQMRKLMHAMGDVHPHPLKGELARELSRITFERWSGDRKSQRNGKPAGTTGKTIFCNSGFEAVEAALKTSLLATGKPGVIAFEGAYHGLGYGALNATHRQHFRGPFRSQLAEFSVFVGYPQDEDSGAGGRSGSASSEALCAVELNQIFRSQRIGAVLAEPIQVRGGMRLPPPWLLPLLRRLCDEHNALLVLDEIYTGFGRTGLWFACEHTRTVPDAICLGKALTGGFPLSACVGKAETMDAAWPRSTGEAIHTSTFLGHPVGCAMALAQIRQIQSKKLVGRSDTLGKQLAELLSSLCATVASARLILRGRSRGLLAGVEILRQDGSPATEIALKAVKGMLHAGFIVLPEGEHGNVIGFSPPLTILPRQLKMAVAVLARALAKP